MLVAFASLAHTGSSDCRIAAIPQFAAVTSQGVGVVLAVEASHLVALGCVVVAHAFAVND